MWPGDSCCDESDGSWAAILQSGAGRQGGAEAAACCDDGSSRVNDTADYDDEMTSGARQSLPARARSTPMIAATMSSTPPVPSSQGFMFMKSPSVLGESVVAIETKPRNWASELRSWGISVNCIRPASVPDPHSPTWAARLADALPLLGQWRAVNSAVGS